MHILKLAITLLFATLLTGCGHMKGFDRDQVSGSGVIKTEKRTISAFNAIDTSGAFDIEIACQKEPSLELEGDDNLLPLIKTEVRGNTLYINSEKSFSVKKNLRVRISVTNIEGISSSGAGNLRVAAVKNEKLKIDSSGASNIEISGETKRLDMDLSGASKVDTESLRAERVTIDMSGAGKANVYASEELNAEVSGVGSVTYTGDPKVVNPKVSGVGSVSKK